RSAEGEVEELGEAADVGRWQDGAEEDRQHLAGGVRCRLAGDAECRSASAGQLVVEDRGGVSSDDAELVVVGGVGQPACGGLGGRPFVCPLDDGQFWHLGG